MSRYDHPSAAAAPGTPVLATALHILSPASRARLSNWWLSTWGLRPRQPGAYAPGFMLAPAPQAWIRLYACFERKHLEKKHLVRPSILRVRAANARHDIFLTREAGVSIKSRTPAEMLGWGPRPGASAPGGPATRSRQTRGMLFATGRKPDSFTSASRDPSCADASPHFRLAQSALVT